MCPLTIHALLHIAPSIRATGPVWASWEFPIERFCGLLIPAVKNRRFPYASLSNYAVDVAQLKQIALTYNLDETLALHDPEDNEPKPQFRHHGCKCDFSPPSSSLITANWALTDEKAILRKPRRISKVSTQRHNQVLRCLATRYDAAVSHLRRCIPMELEQWGKVQIAGGGDTIHASELVSLGENNRDASFVRVSPLAKNIYFHFLRILLCLHLVHDHASAVQQSPHCALARRGLPAVRPVGTSLTLRGQLPTPVYSLH